VPKKYPVEHTSSAISIFGHISAHLGTLQHTWAWFSAIRLISAHLDILRHSIGALGLF